MGEQVKKPLFRGAAILFLLCTCFEILHVVGVSLARTPITAAAQAIGALAALFCTVLLFMKRRSLLWLPCTLMILRSVALIAACIVEYCIGARFSTPIDLALYGGHLFEITAWSILLVFAILRPQKKSSLPFLIVVPVLLSVSLLMKAGIFCTMSLILFMFSGLNLLAGLIFLLPLIHNVLHIIAVSLLFFLISRPEPPTATDDTPNAP